MLDLQLLRTNLDAIAARLADRGFTLDRDTFLALEAERRASQGRAQELQASRNAHAKKIGQAKAKGEDSTALMAQAAAINAELGSLEAKAEDVQKRQQEFLSVLPNVPQPDVPAGKGAEDNVEVRRWGTPRKFDFAVKDHVDVGTGLGLLDFDTAIKLAGARFSVMKGEIARLHRSIAQLMLDVHTRDHGYTEVYVPYMVTSECADGVTSFAKFKDDLFKIEGRDLYLIPTAEVPVTNFVRDEIVPADQLPMKFACHTPCFRSEAGSYGKDTRGMIRQHQFDKVELVQIVRPEESVRCHEELTAHAETILKMLELPYRTMVLCTGDMGFASAKTYDIEVWLPAQDTYREISSCSNFEAFQARRMRARYRNEKGKPELLHTINGSGLAVGRTLVAILENGQNEDGSVTIPNALRPYMGGREKIVRA